jgi:hypothetical protein
LCWVVLWFLIELAIPGCLTFQIFHNLLLSVVKFFRFLYNWLVSVLQFCFVNHPIQGFGLSKGQFYRPIVWNRLWFTYRTSSKAPNHVAFCWLLCFKRWFFNTDFLNEWSFNLHYKALFQVSIKLPSQWIFFNETFST